MMAAILITILVFMLAMLGLGAGVLAGRGAIKGSCGGCGKCINRGKNYD